jgi:hypothetical protein
MILYLEPAYSSHGVGILSTPVCTLPFRYVSLLSFININLSRSLLVRKAQVTGIYPFNLIQDLVSSKAWWHQNDSEGKVQKYCNKQNYTVFVVVGREGSGGRRWTT